MPRLLPPKLLKVMVIGQIVNMAAPLFILVEITVGAPTLHTRMNVSLSFFARTYRTDWQPPLSLLSYEYDPQAPYLFLYEYDCRRYYNLAYKYKQKPISDEDYEAERKPIWGYTGKNKTKPLLVQEFERKTIPTREPVQESLPIPIPPAPTSAGQKSKSNPRNRLKRLAIVAKDPECQAPNPNISREKVQIVQVVQEVDKPRSRSWLPVFNESTDSGPAIPLPFDT